MKFNMLFCCALIAAAVTGAVRAQTRIDLKTQGKSVDFSEASSTSPSKAGTQLPTTCRPGETFIKTDATPMPAWYLCGPANQWNTANAADKTVANSYTAGARQSFLGSSTTAGLQVAPSALPASPQTGDLATDAADSNHLKYYNGQEWITIDSAAGLSNYEAAFAGQTSITIPGAAHGYGTAALVTQCYDNSTPSRLVEPSAISVDPNTYDVVIEFPAAQSGRCVVNGSGGGGGTAGAGMGSLLGDFAATRTGATTLRIGANCSVVSPCNARFGNRVFSFTSGTTVTIADPWVTDTAFVYIDSSGVITAASPAALTCTGLCAVTGGVSGFPAGSIPLYRWTMTVGAWDVTGGTDARAWMNASSFAAGAGVALAQSDGQTVVGVDAAVVPTYLTATATLDFPSIAAGRCSADLTFSLPGANPGDALAAGWPSALEAGLWGVMRVSASGTIAVRLCADAAGAVNPTPATFRATIVRSF
jgi:hypothetical protein